MEQQQQQKIKITTTKSTKSLSPVGLGGAFMFSGLFVGHFGFLVEKTPFEYATVKCATVNVSMFEIIPVDSVHYGHR